MLGNVFETLCFLSFVAGVYELAGRGWALIAAAPCLLIVALAVEGLHPLKLARAAVSDLRITVARKRAERKQRRERRERQAQAS